MGTIFLMERRISWKKPASPLHVCVITSGHKQRDIRIFVKEIAAFRQAGYQITYLVPGGEPEEGVQVVPLKRHNGRAGRLLLSAFSAFSEAKKQRAQGIPLSRPGIALCGLLLRLCGKKVVYDVHEDVPGKLWQNLDCSAAAA